MPTESFGYRKAACWLAPTLERFFFFPSRCMNCLPWLCLIYKLNEMNFTVHGHLKVAEISRTDGDNLHGFHGEDHQSRGALEMAFPLLGLQVSVWPRDGSQPAVHKYLPQHIVNQACSWDVPCGRNHYSYSCCDANCAAANISFFLPFIGE